MKNLFALSLVLFMCSNVFAQNNQYVKASDSDPAAKAMLKKVKARYEAYKTLEASFVLDIMIPEQEKMVQKGTLTRQGDKYRIISPNQEVICDGNAIWFILPSNKEVQINDMPSPDEDDSILTPQSVFNFYEKDNFVYFITSEPVENGKKLQEITFKPLDRDASDYSKLVLVVNKKTAEIVRVKTFAKDGSRYTFYIENLKPNPVFNKGHFAFSIKNYPDYYVEDLRE